MIGLSWLYSGMDKLLLPSGPPQHQHPDKTCTLCERRIWWWQSSYRLYALGDTLAHGSCSLAYFKAELAARKLLDKK